MRALIAFALALLTGCASAQHAAQPAVAADVATTAVGLSIPGITEANPAAILSLPIRIAIIDHARNMPVAEATPVLHTITASSMGAAVNNLLVIAGFGGFAPVVGLMVAAGVWANGADERDYWRGCEIHRRLANNKALRCEWRGK